MKTPQQEALRITFIGMIANILLAVVKIFSGIFGHSSAMIADGFHSFSDFATDLVVLFSVRIAQRPPDETHNYGHGKYETLAGAIISVMLSIAGCGIAFNGLKCLFHVASGNQIPRPHFIALLAAGLSIVVKELLYHYTVKVGEKVKSPALTANAWHHRSDALSSVATLIGIAGASYLGQRWRVLDPIVAVLVSILILKVGVDIFMSSIHDLLEHALPQEDLDRIVQLAGRISGLRNPHEIRTRKIGGSISIDLHIYVDPKLSVLQAHSLSDELENQLKEAYGQDCFIYIHIEPDPEMI